MVSFFQTISPRRLLKTRLTILMLTGIYYTCTSLNYWTCNPYTTTNYRRKGLIRVSHQLTIRRALRHTIEHVIDINKIHISSGTSYEFIFSALNMYPPHLKCQTKSPNRIGTLTKRLFKLTIGSFCAIILWFHENI